MSKDKSDKAIYKNKKGTKEEIQNMVRKSRKKLKADKNEFMSKNKIKWNNLGISNYTSKNAITLIALVITVIILLILAGISIMALTQSGLLDKTNAAKIETDKINEKEQVNLAIITSKANKQGAIDKKVLIEELSKIKGMEIPEETQELPWIVVGKTGEKYEIDGKELVIEEAVSEGKIRFYINNEVFFANVGATFEFPKEEFGFEPIPDLCHTSENKISVPDWDSYTTNAMPMKAYYIYLNGELVDEYNEIIPNGRYTYSKDNSAEITETWRWYCWWDN